MNFITGIAQAAADEGYYFSLMTGALAPPGLLKLCRSVHGVGYIMVIVLAGLQVIPREYYEAAEIAGASWFARLRHITLPLLMPAILVTTVLNLLYGLKVLDILSGMTSGAVKGKTTYDTLMEPSLTYAYPKLPKTTGWTIDRKCAGTPDADRVFFVHNPCALHRASGIC